MIAVHLRMMSNTSVQRTTIQFALILVAAIIVNGFVVQPSSTTRTTVLDRRHNNDVLWWSLSPSRGNSQRLKTQQLLAQRRDAPPVKEQRPPMNQEITANELRVVTPNPKGKDVPLGIMSLTEALTKAQELGGLDLIMINDKADPPVCKIVDYSKYRYMQEKKAKEVKKNSKGTEIKEVKMSYKIDVHDYDVRKKNAQRFIKQGNRVKCTVMFRGREVQYEQLGLQLLEKLAGDLDSLCLREGKAKREGRNLFLILQPRAEVMKAVNENRKAEEKAKKKKKAEAFAKRDQDELGETTNGSLEGVFDREGEDEDDDDDDDDYEEEEDDDDDEDEELTLDELLGNDELSDELFN